MSPCPEDPDLRDLQVHGSIVLCLPCTLAQPLCPPAMPRLRLPGPLVYSGKLSRQQLTNI